jgi:beta-xylosidase
MIMNVDWPDPSFVLDPTTGNGHTVQVAVKFPDQAEWKRIDQEPLTSVGKWAENHDIWAPDVQYINEHSWVMYYSAPSAQDKSKHCVGAATASSVAGPYTPRDEYISCDLGAGGAIDPSGYYDKASNTRWVVYKIDGNTLGGSGPCGNQDPKPPNTFIHPTPIMLQQVCV